MSYEHFLWFIKERESIRWKKELRFPRPWTDDHILDRTRFCNINRIHDSGTIRLLDFISHMDNWEKVIYTVLYRSALSSQRFLESMTGIWLHDLRNLQYIDLRISDARKPYQVFLYGGDTMKGFLVNVSYRVAKQINVVRSEWQNISIADSSSYIADEFKKLYGKRMIFLSTEIAKDFSYFLPVDSDSDCHMNIGATAALRKMKGGRIKSKVYDLLDVTNLSPSVLEHGLCEYGKYLGRWEYFRKHHTLKKEWLY